MTPPELLRLLAGSHVLLLAGVLLRSPRRDVRTWLQAGFLLSVACYLGLPLLVAHSAPDLVVRAVFLGAAAVPVAFWTLAEAHFDDGFRLRGRHAAVLALVLAADSLCWALVVERRLPALRASLPGWVWAHAPRGLSILVVLYALARVHAGARSDLVEARLRLRRAVLALSGTYVLLVLLGEVFLEGSPARGAAELLNAAGLFAVAFGLSVLLLRFDPDFVAARARPPAPAFSPELLERLRRLLEDERIYKKEGLTIGALAERLGEAEHRVRHLINAQLGFRNFNAFLHHYRIRDARESLRDPARRHLGVGEIAYGLGYQSLGPFNKAFKELTGKTPTEFRREAG